VLILENLLGNPLSPVEVILRNPEMAFTFVFIILVATTAGVGKLTLLSTAVCLMSNNLLGLRSL
jgi:hypothetical protein